MAQKKADAQLNGKKDEKQPSGGDDAVSEQPQKTKAELKAERRAKQVKKVSFYKICLKRITELITKANRFLKFDKCHCL